MSDVKWVRHISGQGEKWKLHEQQPMGEPLWRASTKEHCVAYLPKSEYLPCDPPEAWEDVTEDVRVVQLPEFSELRHGDQVVRTHTGQYRMRKVPICTGSRIGHEPTKQWAFIVERRQT